MLPLSQLPWAFVLFFLLAVCLLLSLCTLFWETDTLPIYPSLLAWFPLLVVSLFFIFSYYILLPISHWFSLALLQRHPSLSTQSAPLHFFPSQSHRSVVIAPEGDLEFRWDSEMCWSFIHVRVTIKLVLGTTQRSVIESCITHVSVIESGITHVSSSPRETVRGARQAEGL